MDVTDETLARYGDYLTGLTRRQAEAFLDGHEFARDDKGERGPNSFTAILDSRDEISIEQFLGGLYLLLGKFKLRETESLRDRHPAGGYGPLEMAAYALGETMLYAERKAKKVKTPPQPSGPPATAQS